jgi:hypothetical protein
MTVKSKIHNLFIYIMVILSSLSCKEKSNLPGIWQGSGMEWYSDFDPFSNKPLRVFYYVPENVHKQTPIVFLFHGIERNAMEYRDALIAKAKHYHFIVVVPEFTDTDFPGSSAYPLGNVFLDGDYPSAETLISDSLWTFSLLHPIFSFVKFKTQNTQTQFLAIGHSAGAQFLHRFAYFKGVQSIQKMVISAAGWYTVPDTFQAFPYGFSGAPILKNQLKSFWSMPVFVQVGAHDNNPNAANLRRTTQTDLQGTHRLARAQYFFQSSLSAAEKEQTSFGWSLKIIPNLNHNFQQAVPHAADHLFQ